MKKTKSNLDERQEWKLLKIEHNGCWLAFWGLLAAILIQQLVGGNRFQDILGEWVVFMCLAVYMAGACLKNGIWDRKLKPNLRTNALASGIAGLVMAILWFAISYRNYHNLVGSLSVGAVMFFSVGLLCLVALTVLSRSYKKKVKKLEEADEEPME